MQDSSRRRVETLSRQLLPDRLQQDNEVCPSNSADQQELTRQATSATDQSIHKSSYARVHGEVSREPADWTNVASVQQQKLHEVLYHKALQEGIAKVCNRPAL